jgi:hypothetical protein
MKTKSARAVVAPLNGNEPLFVKHTDSETGVATLRTMSALDFRNGPRSFVFGPEHQFLTWNGQNFAWKHATNVEAEPSTQGMAVHLLVNARTGCIRSVVHQDAMLRCMTAVYGLTKEFPEGEFRPARHCAAGRSLSSVSGPCLLSEGGGVGVPWNGSSFHAATVQVTKAKTSRTSFTPVRIELEDATSVVLSSGLIHRIK